VCGRHFLKRTAASTEIQPALRLIRGADDDVGEAVAVDIASLDHAGDVGSGTKHLRADILESLARATIHERDVRFRRSGFRIVAAVGEQQIEAPVAIDVRDLDFVRPVRGVTDGGGRGVDPEACGQLRACGDQGRHHCGDHSGIQNFHLIFARSSSAQFSTT